METPTELTIKSIDSNSNELAPIPDEREPTKGSSGTASSEASLSAEHLVVKGQIFTESVIGDDQRTRVLDTHLTPWRRICALGIETASGLAGVGTGWFVGPRTVITAGHCVYNEWALGGWAHRITVSPGRNGPDKPFVDITVDGPSATPIPDAGFSVLSPFLEGEDPDFDIGCIHLPKHYANTVGWFSIASKEAGSLLSYLVNVAGYPATPGGGKEHYHHRNRISAVADRRIFYDVDTSGGQSGAPAWIQDDDTSPPVVVGIHAYGTSATPSDLSVVANSATRIIPQVYDQIQLWIKSGMPPAGGPDGQ